MMKIFHVVLLAFLVHAQAMQMDCVFPENATLVTCTSRNAVSCNGTAVVLPCPYIVTGSIDYDLALCAIAVLTGLTLLLLAYALMARNWRNRSLATSSLCFISAASTALGPRTSSTCAPFFPLLSASTLLLIFAMHLIKACVAHMRDWSSCRAGQC